MFNIEITLQWNDKDTVLESSLLLFFALSVIHCMLKLNCTAAFSCSLRKRERRSTVYTAGNLITLHMWFVS